MKKYTIGLITGAFFLLSCTTIDYYGKSVNLGKEGVALKEIERDLDDPDIFWIKMLESDSPVTNVMKRRKNIKRYLSKIMDEYGYSGYQVVHRAQTGLALNYYTREVRFFKTEEEFDKWNRRYKDCMVF